MAVTTRKNKNYTSIFFTDFSEETLEKAVKISQTIEDSGRYAVFKPKKEAILDFIERYNAVDKMEIAKKEPIGYQFEIGGCYFTKVENMDNCFITLRDETRGGISEFGVVQSNDVLFDRVFENKTGKLLYA